MSEGIMTRRKRRTLTGDRQDPSAKRTKTEQSETKEEKKVITGSEPMTRQRKKALEIAAAEGSLAASVASRRGTEPDVTSEEIPLPSEEPEKYENARRQRKRATMTETTGEDSGDQQDGKEKEVMRDEAHTVETEPAAGESEGLVITELPKRHRKKTMKGLELESMLRRSPMQGSPATGSDSYLSSADSAEKPGMEEVLTQQESKQSELPFQPNDNVTDSTYDDSVDSSLWQVFQAVLDCQTQDGRSISAAFLKLPIKKDYPDYYDVIINPLSLSKIRERIKSGYYENVCHLCEELSVVFTNAHTYNEPNSQIYRDARRLLQLVKKKEYELYGDEDTQPASLGERQSDKSIAHSNMSESQDSSSSEEEESEDESEDELNKQFLSLYEAVSLQKDGNDRQLCELFLTLPSAEDYPDYFDVIKHPIDMTMIRDRIEKQQYASEAHCVADFELMFSNARLYNEEDSQIHQDAIILIRLVKRWLRSRQREGQRRNTTQISQRQEPVYGGNPQRYCLGSVDYMLATDVGTCLGVTRGDLYRRYPDVPKRLASNEEKKQLVAQGCGSVAGQVTLLQAVDAEQIMMQEEARKNTLSVCHTVHVPTASENVTWCLRFLPEQLLLHLAIPSESVTLAAPLNAPNKETLKKPSNDSLHIQYGLLETLKACEKGGRRVTSLFIELPSRHQYPDYYQIIRKPIDIKKIESKIRSQQYCSVDDMFIDIILMCDNACRYNELGSEVYMDSQTLLQLALRTRAEMMGVSRIDIYQSVGNELHHLLRCLLQSVTCYETDTGRRPSDSLIPLNETSTPLSTLDDVSQLLDRDGYQRLDEFQQDLFAVLAYARNNHKLDSQIYEDAVLLEQVYITERDRLCVGGVKWSSPALNYQLSQFQQERAKEKQRRLEQEKASNEELEGKEEQRDLGSESVAHHLLTDCCIGDVDCHIGDTVSIMNDDQTTSLLFYIQKMWRDNCSFFEGCRFYFPHEIVLETERKFLDREVLLSHESEVISVQSLHKIYVMTSKQYFTKQPQNFPPAAVYFCESTYSKQTHTIRTFKTWPGPSPPPAVHLEMRSTPLSCERKSVTKRTNRTTKSRKATRKIPNNVVHIDGSGDEGQVYYEQFCVKNLSYKTGDCVYVNTDKHHPCVARIDKMWTDSNGDPWFHGPWFVHPFETEHLPTRMFFVHELLLSSVQDTNPLHSIVGRCAVLVLKDYIRCRPVGLAERDVYVTEARYNETDRQIRKLKGLKKFNHSSQIDADEFYYFDEEIHPLRIPSPFLFRDLQTLFGIHADSQQSVIPGFVRFANEMLPVLRQMQLSLSFPELLQRTAQQWDGLEDALKRGYNEKSHYLIKPVELDAAVDETKDEPLACQCQWSGCKMNFSESAELAAHVLSTAADSHIIIAKTSLGEFPCLWVGCARAKRPFGQLARVVRHVKEVHLKSVALPDVPVASEPSSSSGSQFVGQSTTAENASTAQHILSNHGLVERFVTPPTQQKVHHSNVYLKYVEQLRSGLSKPKNVCERIGDSSLSERQIKDLDSQFLAAGMGTHKSVTDALWALRDAMMLDALKLSNVLEM